MGRIAEALKRAQHERAERLETGSVGLAEPDVQSHQFDCPSAAVAAPQERTPILEPPPSPKPFPVSAIPIQPDAVDPQVLAFHDPTSEIAEKYLHKGARLGIIGTLDQQKWENEEGVMRSTFQLIANSLEFIKTDGRGFEGDQGDGDIPF